MFSNHVLLSCIQDDDSNIHNILIVTPGFMWSWTVMLQYACVIVIEIIIVAPNFGFPGWELAVVGVWEGGAGHGLLLCHFHRQLHGSELCQAPAAAEALGGENQVMTRQKSGTNIQVTVLLLLLRALHSAPATKNKPHPPPLHPFSEAERSETQALFVGVCAFEDVCVVYCSSHSRFCSSSSHLTL